MTVEKIYNYQERLDQLSALKKEAVESYEALVNMLANNKSIIRGLIAKHFTDAQRETKKNAGFETLEAWAANKFKDVVIEKQTVLQIYQDYIYLQEKEKTLSKIIESYSSDISALQSMMKYDAGVS